MTSTYDLSWGEKGFLAKIRLFSQVRKGEKRRLKSKDPRVKAAAYSALSSTYYSIVSTAGATFKSLRWNPFRMVSWCLTWLPLASYCYWRMLPLSNRVVKLIGYEEMSAEQCDVRQTILRCRGDYEEAELCIKYGIYNETEHAHTIGLLYVGWAKIYYHRGELSNISGVVQAALMAAEIAEKQDPRQAIRIYRQCADLIEAVMGIDCNLSNQLRIIATELALAVDAKDQLLKI